MTDSPNEKKFMREKIVKPPVNRRLLARRVLCLVLFAVIFGAVAAVSFVLSKPFAEKFLGKEPTTPSIPITIERDDEPGTATSATETMEVTTTEPVRTEMEEEMVEEMVGKAMSEYPWTPENVDSLNQILRDIVQEADKGIVTVSSVKTQMDWFDNPVESAGQYAGMILAVNSNEIVILTGENALEGAESLRVVFGDGSTASGQIKQKDTVGGMAALTVSASELSESTRNWIEPIELGNSYSVKPGDVVIAVGSPSGRVHSIKQGCISYVAKGVQIADGQTRILYTDYSCNTQKGTFFLNLSGQLIGWATDKYQTDDSPDTTMAMSISEYKGILQKLSNGIPMPYFGIKGQDVTESMQEQGIPQGIYITESIAEGPAYNVGIQNGDILTKIQGEDIISIRDFQNRLENFESGKLITVLIQRKGIDEYKEIEYHVTIGAR